MAFESEVSLLQHVVDNQHDAAAALIAAAEALVPTNTFIEIHDNGSGRPITFKVLDIARIEKNGAGKALVVTVTEANVTTLETYEQVRDLMLQ